jgi:alpha-tubulin suppressor-like RCC1 family protein
MRRLLTTWSTLLALLVGCSNELLVLRRHPERDGGMKLPEAGSAEAGVADAGAVEDAGPRDASTEPNTDAAADSGLPLTTSLAAFDHTCATYAGHLWCWGDNTHAQLGTGDRNVRATPTPISGHQDFVETCAGEQHSCALRADGSLLCWGENFHGEVGVGDTDPRERPVMVDGGPFVRVACGGSVTCAIGLEGELSCWGENFEGQLGQGDPAGSADHTGPTRVAPDLLFQDVGVGQGHVCAVTRAGALYCWGRNTDGQLGGHDDQGQIRTPTEVTPGSLYRSVVAALSHTCAISRDGRLFCWGTEGAGYLGLGVSDTTLVATPTEVGTDANYVGVSINWFHTCALRHNGFLSCWGRNVEGQLGLGDTSDRNLPERVGSAHDWTALVAGHFHSCGFRGAALYCWGINDDSNELGLGAPGRRNQPALVELPAP